MSMSTLARAWSRASLPPCPHHHCSPWHARPTQGRIDLGQDTLPVAEIEHEPSIAVGFPTCKQTGRW